MTLVWTVRHPTAAVSMPRRIPDDLRWALFALGVLLTVIARAAWLSVAPEPDDAEVSLVGQVLAVAGVDPAPIGFSPAAVQVAAWTATGSWARAASVLEAAREAMVVTSVLSGVLLWLLARRLGYGRPWAAAALVLYAICPPLLDVQRTVVAANVALPWLLGALVLATSPPRPGFRGRARETGLVTCVVVGVVTAPVTVALVPAVLWLAAREREPRRAWRLALTVVGAGAGAMLLARVTGYDAAVRDTGLGNLLDPGRMTTDPVTPIVVVVVALLGLAVAATRPVAAGLLLVPVAAVVTGEPWAAVVAVAVPLAVLLIAALVGHVVDTAARPARHRQQVRSRAHLYAPIATAVTVVVALLLWSPVLARLPATLDGGATAAARAWMAEHGSTAQLVLSDSRTQLAVVNARDWRHTRAGPAGEVVATFGQGPDAVRVRSVPVVGVDMQREAAARRAAGEMLAASDRLEAAEPLRELLRAGRVNRQAALTLHTLLADRPVRLVDLPRIEAEEAVGQPRRHLLLQPLDGDTDRIVSFYLLQRGPFRPAAAVLTPDGVLVGYPPVAEPGLLDPFLPEGHR